MGNLWRYREVPKKNQKYLLSDFERLMKYFQIKEDSG